ncbi:MAG: response regulator [Bacteroidetes bacterium]|nr:MAG: response regulator [Bacteroidota bacterium]
MGYNWKDKVILVAEDMEMNFVLLKKSLERTNVTVLRARNGREMIDMVKSNHNIDMVLLDMGMPVMDGYEATRLLRAEGNQIPIIAQTAFAMDNEKNKVLVAGCNDFVEKPINTEILFNKINSLF